MSEPQTKAGRVLLAVWQGNPDGLIASGWRERIIAIEAEAVAAWLDSPDAERRLAAALVGISYNSKPLTELDAAYLANRQRAALKETP